MPAHTILEENLHYSYRNNLIVVLALICGCLFYVNICTPLWGNILLGYGVLVQSEYLAPFPANLHQTEYIRGYFYKALLYFIMKITDLFCDRGNYFRYQQITKVIYYLICFAGTFWAIRIAARKNLKNTLVAWLLTWVVIFTGNYRQFMEAEELAAILAIMHFCCIYSADKKAQIISGLFIFPIIGCKAITILYLGFGLTYLLLFCLNDKAKMVRVIGSHIVFLLLTAGIYAFLIYPEIELVKTAISYQGSMKIKGLATIRKFSQNLLEFTAYLPMLVLIPVSIVLAIRKNIKLSILLVVYVMIASAAVILQNRFSSPYHYLSFLPVGIIGYLLSESRYNKLIFYPLVACMVMYASFQHFNTTSHFEYASNKAYARYFSSQCTNYGSISRELKTNHASELLFLTGDCAPYFIDTKSHTLKTTALLLNRSETNPDLKKHKDFVSYYNAIINYHGSFILLDPDYFSLDAFPGIKLKLGMQYDKRLVVKNDIQGFGETTTILYQKK